MTENWVSLSRNRLGPDDYADLAAEHANDLYEEERAEREMYWPEPDEPPFTRDEIAEMMAEDEADARADAGAYD